MAPEEQAGTEPREFQMNTLKSFHTDQNRLPREGVECLFLEIFQNCLDTALCPGLTLPGQAGGAR